MPRYQREHDENIDENEEIQNTNEPVLDPVETTWQKRYGDLRSHTSREIDALKREIKDMKAGPQAEPEMPKSEAEVAKWMSKFPDVAGIVRTIVLKELGSTRSELNEIRSETKAEKNKRAKDEAQAELSRMHPDFFNDIIERPDFHTWINSKSQHIRDALFVNETDAIAAAEVITLYKLETKQDKKKVNPRDVAEDVPNRGRTSIGNDGEPTFTESQIEAMSGHEYERNEEAINKAHREGKVLMDISGGAR